MLFTNEIEIVNHRVVLLCNQYKIALNEKDLFQKLEWYIKHKHMTLVEFNVEKV